MKYELNIPETKIVPGCLLRVQNIEGHEQKLVWIIQHPRQFPSTYLYVALNVGTHEVYATADSISELVENIGRDAVILEVYREDEFCLTQK